MSGPVATKSWRCTNDEWDAAWAECTYATYFQSREWAEIWAASTRGRFSPAALSLELSDGTRAVLPFSRQRRGLLRSTWLSSPAGTYGGWLSASHLTDAQQAAILQFIAMRFDDVHVRFNPYEQLGSNPPGGNAVPDTTQALDISAGMSACRQRWSKGHAAAHKQARKLGVTVRIGASLDDWKRYYAIYLESLTRWGASTTSRYPWDLFEHMHASCSGRIKLWLAEHNDVPIAGAVCMYSSRVAVYWHGAAIAEHFNLRPVHLMLHEAISNACDFGLSWFDFNPSGGHAGVEAFKKGFGTISLDAPVWRVGRRPLHSRILVGARRLSFA